MNKKRFPHQIEAKNKALHKGGLCFYMGMRTGKTLTALDTIKQSKNFPVLIIAPLGVLATWKAELISEGVEREKIATVRPKKNRKIGTALDLLLNSEADYFLINFDSVVALDALYFRSDYQIKVSPLMRSLGESELLRAPSWLGIKDWKCVVVDESYRIANGESELTKYLLTFPKPSDQMRLCLSGTPAAEGPYQYAPQFIFVFGVYFGCETVFEYMDRYWVWNEYEFKWKVRDKFHLTEIRNHVQEFSYCITMEELGLGCQIFQTIRELEPTPEQIELYFWCKHVIIYERGEEEIEINPATRVLFEQKISAGVHPLTNEIISDSKILDWIEYFEVDRKPLLVSSRFKAPIFRAKELCLARGIRAEIIYSGVSVEERDRIRVAFQNGELDVVIGTEGTIYRGLDFSNLSDMIIMSSGYSAEKREQLELRGNNVMRKEPYQIINQFVTGSLDSHIFEIVTNKKEDARHYLKELSDKI